MSEIYGTFSTAYVEAMRLRLSVLEPENKDLRARVAELERDLEQAKADRARAAMDARNPLMAQLAELEARCKRLEKAGDEMADWSMTAPNLGCDPELLRNWQQAKEAKP